jgi:hypothetical protein
MPNLPRMNPADSHQLSHVLGMAFKHNSRPANPPPLPGVSGAHQMRMKAVSVLELTRRSHPHSLADAFVWLEFIGHKKSVENPNIPSDCEGAGNIAGRCCRVHIGRGLLSGPACGPCSGDINAARKPRDFNAMRQGQPELAPPVRPAPPPASPPRGPLPQPRPEAAGYSIRCPP